MSTRSNYCKIDNINVDVIYNSILFNSIMLDYYYYLLLSKPLTVKKIANLGKILISFVVT